MATGAQVEQIPTPEELAPEEQQGPHSKGEAAQKRIRFDEAQQKAFDRAFAKRERKIRNEYDAKLSVVVADLLDTCAMLRQMLGRCGDKVSPKDWQIIEAGITEIEKEHAN